MGLKKYLIKDKMPQRPSTIPGYVHPEKSSYTSKNRMYKTFTEGLKTNKKETFGTVTVGEYSRSAQISMDKCPICNDNPVYISNCQYNVKRCCENHYWFTDRSGEIKIGNPNKF